MVKIYILDVPEFQPIVEGARRVGIEVGGPSKGYFVIAREGEVVLSRKTLGLKPAVWYSSLSGGLEGRIAQFDRDTLRIVEP
jgi:hypothetical protein